MKVAGTAAVLAQRYDKTGRADREYRADHDKQYDREHAHDILHRVAEVLARDLRDGRAVVSLADHAGEIVVYAAGENRAERDPQKDDRTPERTLKCAEDRAEARDVKQLHQKQLPLRHNDVIYAVVDADRRGFPVVRTESVVHNFTVGQITCDKKCQTYDEADHKTPLLETEHMKMDSLTVNCAFSTPFSSPLIIPIMNL